MSSVELERREDWRAWLEANHATSDGVCVGLVAAHRFASLRFPTRDAQDERRLVTDRG